MCQENKDCLDLLKRYFDERFHSGEYVEFLNVMENRLLQDANNPVPIKLILVDSPDLVIPSKGKKQPSQIAVDLGKLKNLCNSDTVIAIAIHDESEVSKNL
jgi:hypothetical protein